MSLKNGATTSVSPGRRDGAPLSSPGRKVGAWPSRTRGCRASLWDGGMARVSLGQTNSWLPSRMEGRARLFGMEHRRTARWRDRIPLYELEGWRAFLSARSSRGAERRRASLWDGERRTISGAADRRSRQGCK